MKKRKLSGSSKTITYVILFALLCIVGFYPLYGAGKSFVWKIDSAGQYLPAFVYIGEYLRRFFGGILHGQLILPEYDLSIGMGEGVIGTLNYYGFGDPFNIISVFTNKTNAAAVFAASYFLRIFCAGLAFMYYLSLMGIARKIRPLGAVCYIFSGFSVSGCIMYLSWGSALVLLPLVLSGIELIKRKKSSIWLLILSTAFGVLCGFYFLYMSTLALIVYCLTRFLFSYIKQNNIGYAIGHTLLDCAYCAAVYAVGILLASPFFIPSVKAYFASERNSSAFDIIFNYHYYVPQPSALLDFIKTSVIPDAPERLSFIFGILLVEWVMMIVIFFMTNTKRRVQLKIAVALMLVAGSVKITGYLFNAFGETNDRYAFIFHFLAAVVFCDCMTNVIKGEHLNRYSLYAAYSVAVVNIIFNIHGLYSPSSVNFSEDFVPMNEVSDCLYSPVARCNQILDEYEKGEVFRVATDHFSTVNDRPENDAMINGYYGLPYWFSIVNGSTQTYVDEYNREKMLWRSYGFNDDEYALALAGCKYYVNQDATYSRLPLYKGFAFVCNEDELEEIENSGMPFDKRSKALYGIADYECVKNVRYDNVKSSFTCEIDSSAFDRDNGKEDSVLVVALPYTKEWRAFEAVDFKISREVDITQTEMYCSIPLTEDMPFITISR